MDYPTFTSTSADERLVTTGKIMTVEELDNVKGRAWEDVDVSTDEQRKLCSKLTQRSIEHGSTHIAKLYRVMPDASTAAL